MIPKPKARYQAWPEQAGFLRAQMCCSFLEPILNDVSRELYLQVRKAVFDWDVASNPDAVATSVRMKAAQNARWRKVG